MAKHRFDKHSVKTVSGIYKYCPYMQNSIAVKKKRTRGGKERKQKNYLVAIYYGLGRPRTRFYVELGIWELEYNMTDFRH